jgi:hypothetical protein
MNFLTDFSFEELTRRQLEVGKEFEDWHDNLSTAVTDHMA